MYSKIKLVNLIYGFMTENCLPSCALRHWRAEKNVWTCEKWKGYGEKKYILKLWRLQLIFITYKVSDPAWHNRNPASITKVNQWGLFTEIIIVDYVNRT
jgi:hypothetical protein